MNLKDKNVFISGGTSGIGLACANLFAQMGASIFVFSIDDQNAREQALRSIRESACKKNQRFEAAYLDVIDNEKVNDVMARRIDSCGAPYILINSAGIGGAIKFEELSFERFDNTLRVNLYGARNVIAACLPHMKKSGGHIVNVSSFAGLVGSFGYTAYSSAKFAVVGFSESLRSELKQYGIYVSVLCPSQVDTPMLKATNEYKPKETLAINKNVGIMSAKDAAAGLLAGLRKNRFIIIPGFQGKFVYFLSRLFPRFREWITDRIIRKTQKR